MFAFLLGAGATGALIASGWVWQHAWTVTNSGIHEILAAILLLIAATLFAGYAVIRAIETATHRLTARVPPAPPQPGTGPAPTPSVPPSASVPALHARATLLEALQAAQHTP